MKTKQTPITRSARGRQCTMGSPMCNGDPDTVVWCHSDMQIHGKGRGIKARLPFGFYGCSGCNFWYDDSDASKGVKDSFFWAAFSRTLNILLDEGLVVVAETQSRPAPPVKKILPNPMAR